MNRRFLAFTGRQRDAAGRGQTHRRMRRRLRREQARLAGRWYLIAGINTRFEGVRAPPELRILPDERGRISLRLATESTWRQGMRRFWPASLRPGCTLLFIDEGATECVIGADDKSAAWILSRIPRMSNERIVDHAALLRNNSFNPGRLRFTNHR